MTETDEIVESFRRAAEVGMSTVQELAAVFENIDWVALADLVDSDETGGMTIDELLDDIDSVLADHRGVKGDT